MASVKIASLFIKTVSKPIANKLKQQAQEHESFRRICISLAQGMHQTEVKLRTGVMGEPKASIRPLNDAKAITNGATALAEGFLFFVGVSLVVGEAWRSSRSASKRRDDVDERLERLEEGVAEFQRGVDERGRAEEDMIRRQEDKLERLEAVLQQVIAIGLRGGWLDPSTLPSPPASPSPSDLSPSSASNTTPSPPSSSSSSAAASIHESQILPFVRLQAETWAQKPPPPLLQPTRSFSTPLPASSSASTSSSLSRPTTTEVPRVEKDPPEGTDIELRLA